MKYLKNINFKKLAKELDIYEEKRNSIIKESRDLIKLSKKLIYATHRENKKEAEKHLTEIKKSLKKLNKKITSNKLELIGTYNVALQEYVEAVCFYEFVFNKKIPSNKELNLKYVEPYLTGISDLTGELTRFAFKKAMDNQYNLVIEIRNVVDEIMLNLSLFDFANGELRRKYDSIKYNLKRLDDLVMLIKFKNQK